MNNQLSEMMMAEKAEVERILYVLSQLVKGNYYHFHFNLEILEELDFVFAKHSMDINMIVAYLVSKRKESLFL